jgi:tetratricopeptide (TPR) repeat protein
VKLHKHTSLSIYDSRFTFIYLRFLISGLRFTLMKRTLLLVITSAVLAGPQFVAAQEMHPHMHEHTDKLGQVNFRTSCSHEAQMQFNHAVAWLHSFEYEEAEKAFTEVTTTDPRCGLGYWGIAMSHYHPLWAPPSSAELQKGWSAVEKGKTTGARTQREQDYLAAIEVFYKDADKLDHRTRTFAYSDAMKQLHQRYATDNEAGVFYALTLIATGTMSHDKSYAREKEAAQILNRVLAREPQHPGVSHYLIHSYDYPALAQLALPAARSYAKLAPASAHAQHMPSHIFTRLGLWQEAIRSNLDAKKSAQAFAVRNHLSGVWDEQFHSMDYLAYAYLQGAQDKHARGVLEELNKIPKAEPETFKVAYAVAAISARYALERRRWDEAAKLTLPTLGGFPWQHFRWAEAHIYFARAIGAARTGDIESATREVNKLKTIRQELLAAQSKGDYDWAKQVEIEGLVASAWLAQADSRSEEALRLMRAAADLDDATDKHPVTPGAILPAREQLGELLLELKQPSSALQEFKTSLVQAPNRFNGLYGAARAARLAGDQKTAKSYYGKLVALSRYADTIRPEIEEAKAFLTER